MKKTSSLFTLISVKKNTPLLSEVLQSWQVVNLEEKTKLKDMLKDNVLISVIFIIKYNIQTFFEKSNSK